jgi:cytoskeletal protein CcmA (bactofilin family)
MALWKEAGGKEPTPAETMGTTPGAMRPRPEPAPAPLEIAPPRPRAELKESIIAAGLTFEGKIEGTGNVRIAGRFKGDVQVDGTLFVEQGAHLGGTVRAGSVVVAGELEGNIEAAQRVEVQQTGAITGDVTAGSLSVAAGARMRGRVEFGWTDAVGSRPAVRP